MNNQMTNQSPETDSGLVPEFAEATKELRHMAAHLSNLVPALQEIHRLDCRERGRAHDQAELMIYGMLVQIPALIQKHVDTLREHLTPVENVSICYVEDVVNDKFWEPVVKKGDAR